MAKVLTQAEIDALLTAAGPAERSAGRAKAQAPVVKYNFRRPDRISTRRTSRLYDVHFAGWPRSASSAGCLPRPGASVRRSAEVGRVLIPHPL